MTPKPSTGSDLLGASRLAVEAVTGVTELVEAVHMNVLERAFGTPVVRPLVRPVVGVTSLVYRSIKTVTRTVGGGVDSVARRLVPVLDGAAAWPGREALVAALNGVLGDRLAASGNPLAIAMQLQARGAASPRIVVLAHGLCMGSGQWLRDGVDHGDTLAAERGYTPVYLDYNSGLHISMNGRAFAQALQTLVDDWPVPVQEIVIVGHSMGGLVARSACHYAELAGQRWLSLLTRMVFLGTPHAGAPLERGGNWIGMLTESSVYSKPFARLAKLRSAGITDLRHGSLLDEAWEGRDRFTDTKREGLLAPPQGVRCYAIGATVGKRAGDLKDRLLVGDGLVPLASALGEGFETAIVCQTNHMQLLSSPQVRAHLLAWL